MQASERTVAVWKSEWLPPSETFIRNQVGALSRWQPVKVGWARVGGGIDEPDVALLGRFLYARARGRTTRSPLVQRLYVRELTKRRVDLVHAHFGSGAVEARELAHAAGLPLVATFHGVDVTAATTGHSERTRAYRRRLREVFDYATTLIAVSGHIADRLQALGAPADKVVVHHIGTQLGHSATSSAAGEGVLFVGRLVEKKGLEDLIRAMASLPAPLRDTPLTVVGRGPLESAARAAAAQLGVEARFVGAVSSERVVQLMSAARLVCVPSRTAANGDTEGLPMVLLEAAALQRPIVATDHAGIPDFVRPGVTGLLSVEGSIDGLSRNLASVLEDESLASSLAGAAAVRVEEEFDLRVQTALLEDIYDAAAARGCVPAAVAASS